MNADKNFLVCCHVSDARTVEELPVSGLHNCEGKTGTQNGYLTPVCEKRRICCEQTVKVHVLGRLVCRGRSDLLEEGTTKLEVVKWCGLRAALRFCRAHKTLYDVHDFANHVCDTEPRAFCPLELSISGVRRDRPRPLRLIRLLLCRYAVSRVRQRWNRDRRLSDTWMNGIDKDK